MNIINIQGNNIKQVVKNDLAICQVILTPFTVPKRLYKVSIHTCYDFDSCETELSNGLKYEEIQEYTSY